MRRRTGALDHAIELLPFFGQPGQRAIAERSSGLILDDDPQRAAIIGRCAGAKTHQVVLTRLGHDPSKTVVRDAKSATGGAHGESDIVRILRIQRFGGFDRHGSLTSPIHRPPSKQMFPVLERTVLHQLGIQSAVGAIVDVFKEHAVQQRADGMAGMVGVDGDPDRWAGGASCVGKSEHDQSGQAGEC